MLYRANNASPTNTSVVSIADSVFDDDTEFAETATNLSTTSTATESAYDSGHNDHDTTEPGDELCEFLALYGIETKPKTFYFAKSFECDNLPPNLFVDMWRHFKRHTPRSVQNFDDFLHKCGISSVERIIFVHDGNEFEKLDSKWKEMWSMHLQQGNKRRRIAGDGRSSQASQSGSEPIW